MINPPERQFHEMDIFVEGLNIFISIPVLYALIVVKAFQRFFNPLYNYILFICFFEKVNANSKHLYW